ncbi:MAG: spinster family MFS transporter [Janibacter sp.]
MSQRWFLLAVLTLANLVNFYDRTIPAVIVEPLSDEFGLSDTAIGVLGGSFTIVYAIAGVIIGRLADRYPRRVIMAVGLLVWSLFTAGSGLAAGFVLLFLCRLGVGIGEASYGPAANSVIFDAYEPKHRGRAISIFSLGIPLGLLTAFLTVGPIVEMTGSWRVPFLIATVPGVLLAGAMLLVREPRRGASDDQEARSDLSVLATQQPFRQVLAVPTVRWLMVAGVGLQIPTYAVATFIVPLLQRYHGLGIAQASIGAGAILGLAGIIGLLLGGTLSDRAASRAIDGRLRVGAIGFTAAVPVTFAALLLGAGAATPFVLVFTLGWVGTQLFAAAASPAIADVVPPGIRATALGVYFASFNIIGATLGPIITGALSDLFARPIDGLAADAVGLHDALLVVVPLGLVIAALGAWRASATLGPDHRTMTAGSDEGGVTARS